MKLLNTKVEVRYGCRKKNPLSKAPFRIICIWRDHDERYRANKQLHYLGGCTHAKCKPTTHPLIVNPVAAAHR